jgi:hypothetical protein
VCQVCLYQICYRDRLRFTCVPNVSVADVLQSRPKLVELARSERPGNITLLFGAAARLPGSDLGVVHCVTA